MKERLVEDWLTRINERGYEIPFCQILVSKGFRVLRCGHSPYEHGKDVLAISPDGKVYGYQLKSGDVAQADVTKHMEQIRMLVETRPAHPALADDFVFQPVFVTTGEFKDPAISLIKELNLGFVHRKLPSLAVIGGRQLLTDFVQLSADFWPKVSPEVRAFRGLYLSEGQGDLDVTQLSKFIGTIIGGATKPLDLERRAAACNLFASYLLGPFFENEDHWSIFQGWMICAAAIAQRGEVLGLDSKHWEQAFHLAKDGALSALRTLADEALKPDAFRVYQREVDDYTRVRNTLILACVACVALIDGECANSAERASLVANQIRDFFGSERLLFWGEGAFNQFVLLIWALERYDQTATSDGILLTLLECVSERNHPDTDDPFSDPYVSADEFIVSLFQLIGKPPSTSRSKSVESYTVFPLVILAARRGMRDQLVRMWEKISHVRVAIFKPDCPADLLNWHNESGQEISGGFEQPQSWNELREESIRDDSALLPSVLSANSTFALMFMLAFPHRILRSLLKHLDSAPRSANCSTSSA